MIRLQFLLANLGSLNSCTKYRNNMCIKVNNGLLKDRVNLTNHAFIHQTQKQSYKIYIHLTFQTQHILGVFGYLYRTQTLQIPLAIEVTLPPRKIVLQTIARLAKLENSCKCKCEFFHFFLFSFYLFIKKLIFSINNIFYN